jgi:hypothetical protein
VRKEKEGVYPKNWVDKEKRKKEGCEAFDEPDISYAT